MTAKILLIPPVTFIVVFILSVVFSFLSSKLSAKTENQSDAKRTCYACGEDVQKHRMQPDYSQFFHFAFFFTVMHVFVLIIACIPKISMGFGNMALFFLMALSGLVILFRK
jgi:NADH-quinone oxidoreductase subunit A